jgi:hypothetical protein
LKLGQTLSTLNFELAIMKIHSFILFYFVLGTSLFGGCEFYNVLFTEFLRPSTKVDEVSDWNMPQWAFISGPQHREA